MAVKLLAEENVRERAEIVVIGDKRVFRMAERVAETAVSIRTIGDIAEADWNQNALPFLDVPSIKPDEITPGKATAAGGRCCL